VKEVEEGVSRRKEEGVEGSEGKKKRGGRRGRRGLGGKGGEDIEEDAGQRGKEERRGWRLRGKGMGWMEGSKAKGNGKRGVKGNWGFTLHCAAIQLETFYTFVLRIYFIWIHFKHKHHKSVVTGLAFQGEYWLFCLQPVSNLFPFILIPCLESGVAESSQLFLPMTFTESCQKPELLKALSFFFSWHSQRAVRKPRACPSRVFAGLEGPANCVFFVEGKDRARAHPKKL
jgi:hypothetical protein